MNRIVITGGGTGGHLYPALAVAEALKYDPDIEDILYIGNTGRKEAELVPEFGLSFKGLSFSGMPRGLSARIIPWFASLLGSYWEARQYLKAFRPDVVFGTGGYVTGPVLMAALSLNIPYVIHEPDAHPGLVNRKMSSRAAAVTCAFADARLRLKTSRLSVTGNPLRSQIGNVTREVALSNLKLPFQQNKMTLLVTGGSQGARKLNQGLLEALPVLIDQLGLQVIHQTGEKLFEEVMAQCPEAYKNHPAYYCCPFMTDMASILALADVAVCRSGSMTLSEMYRAHIPTILVPYPFAAADHQRLNALASQNKGASLMIEDADFTGPRLVSVLEALCQDPSQREAMQKSAEHLAAPHATAEVIRIIKSVAARN